MWASFISNILIINLWIREQHFFHIFLSAINKNIFKIGLFSIYYKLNFEKLGGEKEVLRRKHIIRLIIIQIYW